MKTLILIVIVIVSITSNILWMTAYHKLKMENDNNNAAATELERKYHEIPNN